jgi:hypothetical protein
MSAYVPNEFLAFVFKNGAGSEALLERIAQGLARHTSYRVWERWLSPGKRIGVLNVSTWPLAPLTEGGREAQPTPALPANRLRVRERMAIVQTGYTTTDEAAWEASLRTEGDALRCGDAGGIAAFCLAMFAPTGEEQLFLWATRPGLRVIASADSREVWIAGTRPRLVHLIARDFRAARLDRGYMLSSLVGWSLDDATPYEETSLVPVDALLKVRGAAVATLHAHPTERYERNQSTWLMTETHRYRRALREAVEPLRRVSGFELRMSGGKDSRLVAAALYERGIVPSTPVCHALSGEWESPVAERVAAALGWQLKYAQPAFCFRGDVLASVRHNLSLSDGFFASEPMHAAYAQYGSAGEQGLGLVLGHIELQRGGWAESMKGGPRANRLRMLQHLAPRRHSVAPALVTRVRERLSSYIAELQPISPPETAYEVNYRFRVCRWLNSQLLLHSRVLLPVYPLLDEKVVRVVSNAPLSFLVSESLAFSATCANAPQLRRLGLFRDRYRFEEQKRRLRFMRGYHARVPFELGSSTYKKPEIIQPGSVAETLCEHIRHGKLRQELKEASTDVVWAAIEDPSEERLLGTGIPRKKLSSYLWACFQASVLFTDGLVD